MGEQTLSTGKSVLLLTVLGIVSQVLSFFYRVMLSRLAGAEVMGLYQLVMPVYSVLMSVTAIGLTAAVSNLTAQYLAFHNHLAVRQTLATCLKTFFLLLLPLGTAIILLSDPISTALLGDARTQLGLILLIPCIALTGIENLHKYVFYGSGQVHIPATVELLEQFVRAAAVLFLLRAFLPQYPERVVGLIVLGMVACEIFSSCTLFVLYRRQSGVKSRSGPGEAARIRRRRVASIAIPVSFNSLLGNLISAANATLIPRLLVQGGLERSDAISQFGVVCGMTLPMLAMPTVFLNTLTLLLSPRLARAFALNRRSEIQRLLTRALSVTSILALPAMAWMVVLGPDLGRLMFHQDGVGTFLLPLAIMMAMSCYCSVFASALNAVGCQKSVAVVSLLGNTLQLFFTLLLLPIPGVGMAGYVMGALVSAFLEFLLFLVLTLRRTGLSLRLFPWFTAPGLASLLSALTSNLLFHTLKDSGIPLPAAGLFAVLFALLIYLAALQGQGIRPVQILSFRSRSS